MTEIIHVIYGKKFKCIPLSSDYFETFFLVNIANLKKPISEQLHTVVLL